MNQLKEEFQLENKLKQIMKKKQNERNQKIENMIDEDIDLSRFFELTTTDKIYITGFSLHEIKNEILLDSKGDFELNGSMVIGPTEHKTNNRFKNMDDFENYINAIDIDYDSEVVTFTGYFYKSNTPHFDRVNRSQYGRSPDFKQDFVEYTGNNCCIPTGGNCFIKCIN